MLASNVMSRDCFVCLSRFTLNRHYCTLYPVVSRYFNNTPRTEQKIPQKSVVDRENGNDDWNFIPLLMNENLTLFFLHISLERTLSKETVFILVVKTTMRDGVQKLMQSENEIYGKKNKRIPVMREEIF